MTMTLLMTPRVRALPEPVAWLERVELQLAAEPRDSSFVLAVRSPGRSPWRVRRSAAEVRALQKRLLAALQTGHACHAECAWLSTVVGRHFPKRSLAMFKPTPAKLEARRRALLRVLTTLQASLLNRGNHGCAVLVNGVGREFSDFLLGGELQKLAEDEGEPLTADEDDLSPASFVRSVGGFLHATELHYHRRRPQAV